MLFSYAKYIGENQLLISTIEISKSVRKTSEINAQKTSFSQITTTVYSETQNYLSNY